MVSPARLCLVCKGSRRLCGWRFCPLLAKKRVEPMIKKGMGEEFFGPSTSVFVGHNFYPDVYVGPMASLDTENLKTIDSPQSWFGKPYDKIIEFRSLMLRSRSRESVFSRSRFVEENQELAMASKPTDVELSFRKKPVYKFEYSDVYHPVGPTGTLRRLRITENTKIPRKVEKIVNDEVKAEEASTMLYRKGVDVNRIMTILSSGVMGNRDRRKMVPTRWGITAVDDMLAKNMLSKVRDHPSVNDYMVYESEYLDNHFVIMLMPGNWEFENFEAWSPGSTWSFNLKKTEILEEYEPFGGRKKYASLQAGGYYAARFSVVRALGRMKKQARVVSFREISEGYQIPLGVWIVRSTAADAFKRKPVRFGTKNEALRYVNSRLRIPVSEYVNQSVVLKQRRLNDFSQTSTN